MNSEDRNVSMKDVLDVLLIEKGRLALVDSITSSLSDEDKSVIFTLASTQRENIEHAFDLYREFQPLVSKIDSTGKELIPYIESFLSSGVSSSLVEIDENNYNISPELSVIEGPIIENTITDSSDISENSFIVSADVENEPSENTTDMSADSVEEPVENNIEITETSEPFIQPEVNSEVVETTENDNAVSVEGDTIVDNSMSLTSDLTADLMSGSAGTDSGAEMIPEPVSAETGVVTGSEVVTIPNVEPQNTVELPTVNSVEENSNVGEDELSADMAEFVLSPIDEGVITTPIETDSAKEIVESSDRQLQAVEDVKNEIAADTSLSIEEKQSSIERYTRITENAVKAILVTKAQYEKLLLSRETQKALLSSNSNIGLAQPFALETNNLGQVEVPSVAPSNEVVLPNFATSNEVVLPAIVSPENTNSSMELNSVIALPSIDPNGDSLKTKQQQLQEMMEQANNLYKEGKTQEAQALFNQISVINQELQASQSSNAAGENVLVKKIEGV